MPMTAAASCAREEGFRFGTGAFRELWRESGGRAQLPSERFSGVVLNRESAAEIKASRGQPGVRAKDVAARYGVDFRTVYRIWSGEFWSSVPVNAQVMEGAAA